jgi:hypothetical protein
MATRNELVEAIAAQYARSDRADKARILGECVAVTDFHRRHVMRLLRGGGPAGRSGLRPGRRVVARQSKPLVQRQSAIHPMVEQRSVGKLMSSPKPPEAGGQRARLYTSLITGHHNSRMQLTLEEAHSWQ